MPALRIVLLWHMHQPFYKDLVSGEYRLPWVRLHALKDYYGMVKLLDEFPNVHQTFNLVPSLITQIQEYASGNARDPLLSLISKPAREFSPQDPRAALTYLFQANPVHMIGRYPRYRELWERYRGVGENPERAEQFFQAQDYTDLQVLSQIAWFDEFLVDDPEIGALIRKGSNYTEEEQQLVLQGEKRILAEVLPAYAAAAARGQIEISTSPFYHPILPLLCDTSQGAVSSPGLPLPATRFQHPEDAREQLARGLDLHERVFGIRPRGVWPSEGSVSEQVLAIAHELGIQWMATDEAVLGRTIDYNFHRNDKGALPKGGAEKLYTIYQYEKDQAQMRLFFRDHTLSDLIGFVYSGMPAQEAANHLIQNIKESAQPLLRSGKDAVVSIILDGENAWEYYPGSGREFLRRFYDGLQGDPEIEALTASEAIARQQEFGQISSLVPGSWINANFNVWIGAPEDNRAWDYLSAAREFFAANGKGKTEPQKQLAWEELLIAEGSDWNWWYGPEHHSANDRDFDELYRKHLSNVYHALGAAPPENLAQPIFTGVARPQFVPQTAYIHPQVRGDLVRYFDWVGAAMYTADRRSGSMHGKQFLLDSVYAGIDENNLYGRLDFIGAPPETPFDLVVNVESDEPEDYRPMRLEVSVSAGSVQSWRVREASSEKILVDSTNVAKSFFEVALGKIFVFKLPLEWLRKRSAAPQSSRSASALRDQKRAATGSHEAAALRLRFSIWQERLPIDALPLEGWIELHLVEESELAALVYSI